MSPMEKNARRLVGVLAEFFPAGCSCEDLRRKFEIIANRKHATFYLCLRFAKDNRWIVADEGTYMLNPDGCWRSPPIGEGIERHQFEHVLETRAERIEQLEARNRRLTSSRRAIAAGEAAGPAFSTLVAIMSDPAVPMSKRLQGAENLLAYRTPPDVAEAAKAFLAAVFTNPEENIDHRLAATAALRRAEDPKIALPTERPSTRADPAEEYEPLSVVVARRRARQAALESLALDDPRRGEWSEN